MQEFVDNRGPEIAEVRCDDLAFHTTGHGFQELLEPGIIPQPEEGDLGVHSADSIKFGHGRFQRIGAWGIGECGLAVREQVRCWFAVGDRKSTRLNSSHVAISYAVVCLKKKIHTTFY